MFIVLLNITESLWPSLMFITSFLIEGFTNIPYIVMAILLLIMIERRYTDPDAKINGFKLIGVKRVFVTVNIIFSVLITIIKISLILSNVSPKVLGKTETTVLIYW